MKILVLAGGLSPEREVSLSTGTMVCNALREKGQDAILVDLFYGVEELPGDIESFFADKTPLPPYVIESAVPDLSRLREESRNRPYGTIGKNVIELCKAADIVFMALHGEPGENGMVQAMLDMLDIKYTGAGYRGSAVAMDKALTKHILVSRGINTAEGIMLKRGEPLPDVPLPCIVKPCSGGSSIGVRRVLDRADVLPAVEEAFKYEDDILIESFVNGGDNLRCAGRHGAAAGGGHTQGRLLRLRAQVPVRPYNRDMPCGASGGGDGGGTGYIAAGIQGAGIGGLCAHGLHIRRQGFLLSGGEYASGHDPHQPSSPGGEGHGDKLPGALHEDNRAVAGKLQ